MIILKLLLSEITGISQTSHFPTVHILKLQILCQSYDLNIHTPLSNMRQINQIFRIIVTFTDDTD
jgi:hypothetical protein